MQQYYVVLANQIAISGEHCQKELKLRLSYQSYLVTMALRICAMYQRKTIIVLVVCVFGLYSIAALTVSHII